MNQEALGRSRASGGRRKGSESSGGGKKTKKEVTISGLTWVKYEQDGAREGNG